MVSFVVFLVGGVRVVSRAGQQAGRYGVVGFFVYLYALTSSQRKNGKIVEAFLRGASSEAYTILPKK